MLRPFICCVQFEIQMNSIVYRRLKRNIGCIIFKCSNGSSNINIIGRFLSGNKLVNICDWILMCFSLLFELLTGWESALFFHMDFLLDSILFSYQFLNPLISPNLIFSMFVILLKINLTPFWVSAFFT